MKHILFTALLLSSMLVTAQTAPETYQTPEQQQNTADRLLSSSNKSPLTIGGYGEINYNQPEGDNGA